MNIASYAKIQDSIKTYINDTNTIEFFIVDKDKKKPWEIHQLSETKRTALDEENVKKDSGIFEDWEEQWLEFTLETGTYRAKQHSMTENYWLSTAIMMSIFIAIFVSCISWVFTMRIVLYTTFEQFREKKSIR